MNHQDQATTSHGAPASGPILLVARNSGYQSSKARKAAAREMHAVADDLFAAAGIDVRAQIPSQSELIERLVASRKVTHTEGGRKFKNEFEVIAIDPGLVLLISTGSGKKLDDETFQQPFMTELVNVVLQYRPRLLGCHRLDRISRNMLSVAPLLQVLKQLGTQFFDEKRSVAPLDDMDALMTIFRAYGSQDEASKIVVKTREGMVVRTDPRMENGTANYAAAVTPPPGLTYIRPLTDNGVPGPGQLILDTPAMRPANGVALGVPQVFLNGQPVDQVANVRWALAHLGKPGYGVTRVGQILADRRFSTPRLRQMNGLDTHFDREELGDQSWRAVRAIVENLDFYETGVFHAKLSIKGVDDISITDCFPPSGHWADPADFERIRRYLKSTTGGGPATLGLTGVPVVTSAGRGVLRKAPKERAPGLDGYVIRRPRGRGGVAAGLPVLPHKALAESIVAAIAGAADQVWTAFVSVDSPALAETNAALVRTKDELERALRRGQGLLDGIHELDDEGDFLLSQEVRRQLGRKYDSFFREEVQPLEVKLAALQQTMDEQTAAVQGDDRAAADKALLLMIASLRDPKDTTYNRLWKDCLQLTEIRREPFTKHDHAGTKTTWTGVIRITGAGEVFELPVTGEYIEGAVARLARKVEDIISQLLEGVPFEQTTVTQQRGVRSALAERCGIPSRRFGLASCPDSRLTKIGAHLLFAAITSVDAVANKLGEPVELVRAVSAQLVCGRTRWQTVLEEAV